MRHPSPLAVDRTVTLNVNDSVQHLRICGAGAALPPLLVVQGGPALPLLHEVAKFRRLLNLEQSFLVGYWEQRGCGNSARNQTVGVSWRQQIDDLRTVLAWFHAETKQPVILLGISIGGAMALVATEQDCDRVKALIVVSPDANTRDSDAAVDVFLRNQADTARDRRLARRIAKLPPPPYLDSAPFQQRMRLLADLDTIEHGKSFAALMREMLVSMIRTYGVFGAMKALRNMNLILRRLLAQTGSLDLVTNPPRITVPVHYVFGDRDVVTPIRVRERLPAAIAAPGSTVVRVPDAGHMVHFDRPDIIRSIAEKV